MMDVNSCAPVPRNSVYNDQCRVHFSGVSGDLPMFCWYSFSISSRVYRLNVVFALGRSEKLSPSCGPKQAQAHEKISFRKTVIFSEQPHKGSAAAKRKCLVAPQMPGFGHGLAMARLESTYKGSSSVTVSVCLFVLKNGAAIVIHFWFSRKWVWRKQWIKIARGVVAVGDGCG
jgi:hypothetical protein